jgi:hypothetical protein
MSKPYKIRDARPAAAAAASLPVSSVLGNTGLTLKYPQSAGQEFAEPMPEPTAVRIDAPPKRTVKATQEAIGIANGHDERIMWPTTTVEKPYKNAK